MDLREELIKASEKYLYTSIKGNRDKEDDKIIFDEVNEKNSALGTECKRELWIEALGIVTIYKFTAGIANGQKYKNTKNYSLGLAKMRKALKSL